MLFDIFDIITAVLFTIVVLGAKRFFTITSSNYQEKAGMQGVYDYVFACIWTCSFLISLYHLGSTFVGYLNS